MLAAALMLPRFRFTEGIQLFFSLLLTVTHPLLSQTMRDWNGELNGLSYPPRGCIDFPPVSVHLIETQLCESKVNESVSVLERVSSFVN